jgi:phenylalanyl-tRNA synthetase beta chain
MIVSTSWLSDYVEIAMSPPELAEALTMVGLEVEEIRDRFDYLQTVVVGRIVDIQDHPQAPRLKICTVDINARSVNLVCGAPNLSLNMLAPVALPGTRFPNGFVLEKTLIRGQVSEAMLCSEFELGLGQNADGIMMLDIRQRPGNPLKEALQLSDYMLEIGLTPNRSDCLSLIGIAREIAAIQNTPLKTPDVTISDPANRLPEITSVTISAPDHCPRYAARVLEGIRITPSPFWLQDRLASIGLRPINAIVDITNFVMMETGQPLHAFDFDRLEERRIVVRTAVQGEKFTTLDGKTRGLSTDALLICDGKKPVAIGGIMGGENSEIQADTTRVLLESAYFTPESIRTTSKKLGLQTEASHRFERGVDPKGTKAALNRAAKMMAEISGGRMVEGIIDAGPHLPEAPPITLSARKTNAMLGTSFGRDTIEEFLNRLRFQTWTVDSETLSVIPPSFRVDVSRPEDLIEEVARFSGYQRIPTSFPAVPADKRSPNKIRAFRDHIRNLMAGLGLSEVINYSFMDIKACDRMALPADDRKRRLLAILNPISEDQTVMRTTLLPGLLSCMYRNLSQQITGMRVFEIGNCFLSDGPDRLPEETEYLAVLFTGARFPDSWHQKPEPCDFFDLKGVLETLFDSLKLRDITFTRTAPHDCSFLRPWHSATILANTLKIGLVGEIDPRVKAAFDLRQTAFLAEINMDLLRKLVPETIQSRPLSRFPSISRDITLIVDRHTESQTVLKSILEGSSPMMESAELFDAFEGDPIPAGQKSLSFRIVYRSDEKTLEDKDVSEHLQNTTFRLMKEFDAELPG